MCHLWGNLCIRLYLCFFSLYRVTPLHEATNGGYFDVYQLILEQAANKNPKNIDGITPLDIAAFKGDFEISSLILKNVKDIYHEDFERSFYFASQHGFNNICESIRNEQKQRNIYQHSEPWVSIEGLRSVKNEENQTKTTTAIQTNKRLKQKKRRQNSLSEAMFKMLVSIFD